MPKSHTMTHRSRKNSRNRLALLNSPTKKDAAASIKLDASWRFHISARPTELSDFVNPEWFKEITANDSNIQEVCDFIIRAIIYFSNKNVSSEQLFLSDNTKNKVFSGGYPLNTFFKSLKSFLEEKLNNGNVHVVLQEISKIPDSYRGEQGITLGIAFYKDKEHNPRALNNKNNENTTSTGVQLKNSVSDYIKENGIKLNGLQFRELLDRLERYGLPRERTITIVSEITGITAPFNESVKASSLPEKAPALYADRKNRKENIVEFLQSVWGDWISAGALSQPVLRRLDPQAYLALRNWMKTNELPANLPIPTKMQLVDQELANLPRSLRASASEEEQVRTVQRLAAAARRRAAKPKI